MRVCQFRHYGKAREIQPSGRTHNHNRQMSVFQTLPRMSMWTRMIGSCSPHGRLHV